ncbi:MAG: hypothetical protein HY425_01730 [Candidatus Levybacteria bacterium]|nr:hypothetical protein [Candidatus Levybacteria bacterium]
MLESVPGENPKNGGDTVRKPSFVEKGTAKVAKILRLHEREEAGVWYGKEKPLWEGNLAEVTKNLPEDSMRIANASQKDREVYLQQVHGNIQQMRSQLEERRPYLSGKEVKAIEAIIRNISAQIDRLESIKPAHPIGSLESIRETRSGVAEKLNDWRLTSVPNELLDQAEEILKDENLSDFSKQGLIEEINCCIRETYPLQLNYLRRKPFAELPQLSLDEHNQTSSSMSLAQFEPDCKKAEEEIESLADWHLTNPPKKLLQYAKTQLENQNLSVAERKYIIAMVLKMINGIYLRT